MKLVLLHVCLSVLAAACAAESINAENTLVLNLQRRDPATGRVMMTKEQIHPAKTAIVVIDMWDRHWCRTYTARVANMVPRMNKTLDAARNLGIQIVFAPSDVVDFYKDYPQRKAMQAIPACPPPKKVTFNPPPEPKGKDCCECGPTQPCRRKSFGRWSRQHPGLKIAEADLIGDCNNERELLNFCQHRRIDTLIYMGVASNMCVLHRKFGMLNMKTYAFNEIFVSDLVQAITANGLEPAQKIPDWNFTPAKGSAVVRRYLERHVAPSFESRRLIAAAGMDPFARDKRPHIVFVMAEQEYKSNETLPAFAKTHLEEDFRCTFLFARGDEGQSRNDVPGLEALYDADLLVLAMRRRALPVTQMDHLERYIRSGKPIVGIRVTVVPFQVKPENRPDGHVIWRDFDQQVLGCHYHGYDRRSRENGCNVWVAEKAKNHPILRGMDPPGFHSTSWLYRLTPLTESATLLMEGRWSQNEPVEPVAFTNTYNGARVFFTSLGHPDDFENQSFCKLLVNGVYWGLGKRVP
jgi:nicotinamidase-related amidase/type 1 glutamine amidotransferase